MTTHGIIRGAYPTPTYYDPQSNHVQALQLQVFSLDAENTTPEVDGTCGSLTNDSNLSYDNATDGSLSKHPPTGWIISTSRRATKGSATSNTKPVSLRTKDVRNYRREPAKLQIIIAVIITLLFVGGISWSVGIMSNSRHLFINGEGVYQVNGSEGYKNIIAFAILGMAFFWTVYLTIQFIMALAWRHTGVQYTALDTNIQG